MSFRRMCLFGARAFELVRRSLLQAPGLPFGEALSADQMQAAFDAEGVSFGEQDDDSGGLADTPAITPPATAADTLTGLRLRHGSSHSAGKRPNRIEPRAIKRRPKPHKLLGKPRAQARAELANKRAR